MTEHVIKVLVVEDKMLIAEDIASVLRRHGFEVTAICGSAEEAIESAGENPPDLVLMDIQLAGKMDGITAAGVIKKLMDVPVVYLSDYTDKDTIQRAKQTLPENYLSKPFQEHDLVRAIELAFHNFNNRSRQKQLIQDAVFLRTENQSFIKIPLNEILYLEADRAYCKVICKTGQAHLLSSSMNHVHEQLPQENFMKVHRSFVINIDSITGFEGNMVKIGKVEITMNNKAKDELTSRLKFIK
jgi:DNA-binding LytR/AlgR family response regulator